MQDIKEIREMAKKLFLHNIANGQIRLKEEHMSNLEYLEYILGEELRIRKLNRIKQYKKKSSLPDIKWKIRKKDDGSRWQIDEMMKLKFVKEESNIIITGNCQTGKTALAVMICTKAIENGSMVKYLWLDDFISACRLSGKVKKYASVYKQLTDADIIVIDDFLYSDVSREDLNLLYKSLMFFNESRSIILISNRSIHNWESATDDKHLMKTLVDRIKNGSHIIML